MVSWETEVRSTLIFQYLSHGDQARKKSRGMG